MAQGLLGAWLIPQLLPAAHAGDTTVEWVEVQLPPCHGGGTMLQPVVQTDDAQNGSSGCLDCLDCPYSQACNPAPGLIGTLPTTAPSGRQGVPDGVTQANASGHRHSLLRPPIS